LMPYGVGLVILIPTLFASIYVSYKDIFLAEPLRFADSEPQLDHQENNWNTTHEEPKKHEDEPKLKMAVPVNEQ
jgi:hypothetical protein